ncbi:MULTISPECIES: PLAT/LH2 domain-containing protein [unclassified Sphingomonas]|uniref:PLAT/LH2 domain-containing protein n=1 Tax=unclassified Sphingomonas TaxID=196159 RepID=UPI000BDCEAE9|nr:MAG: hypothetical protein B7Y98_04565 [Sphingomonas sp. 32-62-10]
MPDYLDPKDYGVDPASLGRPADTRMHFAYYQVTTKTSQLKDSGTDDQIYVRLYGVNGISELMLLKNKPRYDETEAGDTDSWTFGPDEVRDLGPIYKLGVLCPQSDAWRPEWIEVTRVVMMNAVTMFTSKTAFHTPGHFVFGNEMQLMNEEQTVARDLMSFTENIDLSAAASRGMFVKIIDWSRSTQELTFDVETNLEYLQEFSDSIVEDLGNRTKAAVGYTQKTEANASGIGPNVSSEVRADFEAELTKQLTKSHNFATKQTLVEKITGSITYLPNTLHFFFFEARTPAKVGTASWFDGTSSSIAIPNFAEWAIPATPTKKVDVKNENEMTPDLKAIWEAQNGRPWPGFGLT